MGSNHSNGHFEVKHQNSMNLEIPRIHFPEIGDKVKGRVTRVTRKGVFVLIGYHSMNGRERHGFLPLEQIKCTQKMIKNKMREYERLKKEEDELVKEWEEYERAWNRQKNRLKRKRKRERKKEEEAKGIGNLRLSVIQKKKKQKQRFNHNQSRNTMSTNQTSDDNQSNGKKKHNKN